MIRRARAEDVTAVRDCVTRAYAPFVAVIGRRPAPMDDDHAGQIARGVVHVAVEEGAVVGVLVSHEADGAMMLENVAVRPDAAGRGIGRALIAFCEAEARRAGLDRVRLYTNAAMTANLRLYPRLGYVEIGRWEMDGFDRVHFEKPLAL